LLLIKVTNEGKPVLSRMPNIETVIINSIRVNPLQTRILKQESIALTLRPL
jgi:hypothetical protein